MRKPTVLMIALALAGICSLASAQEFSENFDSYAPGTPLHGVAGWKGWGNVAGAGAPVSNKYAYSGTNSVEVVGSADLVHEFTANGGLWKFTAMQYVPSGSTGNTYFIMLNQYDDPGATNDWSVQLNYSLSGGTITAEAEGGSAVANIVYDRWIELKFIIDLDANTCQWFYDGELIKTHTWDANGHKTIQALDLYGNNASSVYVDNIKLSMYDPAQASEPTPADKQTDVVRDAALRWMPALGAVAHDVYLGASLDAITGADRDNPMDVLVSQAQGETSYTVTTPLEFGQTYYWRIDEIGPAPDNEIAKGRVWSFTVEPYVYPITAITATASSAQVGMGPENAVNGAGLDGEGHSSETTQMWMTTGTAKPDWIQFEFGQVYKLDEMWVWNSNQMIEALLGFGAKDVTVEYSTDGQTWAVLDGVPAFAQATGLEGYQANTKVSFGGVLAKFVKLTINANWGGFAPQTGLSEVRFHQIPVQAFAPAPADGAAGVPIGVELDWRPGREATSHKVYVDADRDAVANGTVTADTTEDHGYTPGNLDLATTYYWKVDEIGDTGEYPGNVWSFTTSEYDAIDDFEAYNDDDNRIYDSWIDGLTSKSSGSQVGYDVSPFAEQKIVHGGEQSMPLIYNNAASPFYSEAERAFASPQDWTTGGGDTLSLYFQGKADNGAEGLYLIVKDNAGKSKTIAYSNAAATTTTTWQQWVIPLSDLTAAGVKVTAVKSLTIGVGNRTSPKTGGAGTLYIDDIAFGNPDQ
jgi:hypothetical protein